MQVEILPVVLAAVLNMVVGYAWYSPWLFGKVWAKLAKVDESEMNKRKWAPIAGFACSLVIAYFLAFFQNIGAISNVSDGMLFSGLLWLGFNATAQISGVIWVGQPFRLFILNAGGSLLGYLVMGGFIAS